MARIMAQFLRQYEASANAPIGHAAVLFNAGDSFMNRFIAASCMLLSVSAQNAWAACEVQARQNGNALRTLVEGSLVCGRPGPGFGGNPSDRWQEEHRVGGQLWDYKKGPSDPVDPSEQVGSWEIQGGNVVSSHYASGGSFTYSVHLVA